MSSRPEWRPATIEERDAAIKRLQSRLTYANVMSTLAVFIALGGGAYAATTIPGPGGVIHGCYKDRGGNLRLVAADRKCARHEASIAFSEQGPRGPMGPRGAAGKTVRGNPGATGSPGAIGETGPNGGTGPAGPGASSFTTTVSEGSGPATLATPEPGLTVTGECLSGNEVALRIATTGSGALTVTGTQTKNHALGTVEDAGVKAVEVQTPIEAAFDVIANDHPGGKFTRIDVDGLFASTCHFVGMVIPST
jgi:hypothetical protein